MRPNSDFPTPQRVFDKETATKIKAVHAQHVANGALYEERMTNSAIFQAEDRAAQAEAGIDHALINRALAEIYGYGAPFTEPVRTTGTDQFSLHHIGELLLGTNLAVEGVAIS